MILTVTMNASVDITYIMDDFRINETNRVENIRKTAGGKGLNVTRVLAQVGADVLATGLTGGTTGAYIDRQLEQAGIHHHFLHTQAESRNNISIVCGGSCTEILEKGSRVSEEEQNAFIALYQELLRKAGTAVLSGSLPGGLPDDFYARLVQAAQDKGVRTLLDTSGRFLKAGISSACPPFLIKPNEKELGELAGIRVDPADAKQIREVLMTPFFDRIPYVLVSLGKRGAMLRHDQTVWQISVPHIEAVNPIGSGDSVIAGLAYSLDRGSSMEEAVRTGMTFGVLNALEPVPGMLNMQRYTEIYNEIEMEII